VRGVVRFNLDDTLIVEAAAATEAFAATAAEAAAHAPVDASTLAPAPASTGSRYRRVPRRGSRRSPTSSLAGSVEVMEFRDPKHASGGFFRLSLKIPPVDDREASRTVARACESPRRGT
jgi:hypothetical protein